ncbi:MAG: hypothetical protein GY842_25510 [bacterium]|nr:hypothetical protein [bacterium]
MIVSVWAMCLAVVLVAPGGGAEVLPGVLPGFELSPHFSEQVRIYTFDPGVTVHVNAPAAARFDPGKNTRVVIYALPNGNTIAQTVGRRKAPDVDWHFFIQHIGAQIRRMREVVTQENIVVAYVEAEGRSWPSWRRTHPDSGQLIVRLIDSIRANFHPDRTTVELASHSGGGSLIFGYLNQVERIPDWVHRIIFLDSNYGYSDEQRHADKLLDWLRRQPDHHLGVIAYDDRQIRVNGKLVVGPTGGTYRKTQRMLERFGQDVVLAEESLQEYKRYHGLKGRIDIILLINPDNLILHTVLVEKNGLIHSLTSATPHEERAGRFWGPHAYDDWIQPD